MSLIPVFPRENFPLPSGVDEAAANDAAKARSREGYFKSLGSDPEFANHVIHGWLLEQETDALRDLERARSAKGILECRAAWKAVKGLRAHLMDALPLSQTLQKPENG